MSQKTHIFYIYSGNNTDIFLPSRYFNYNDVFQDLSQPWNDKLGEWGARSKAQDYGESRKFLLNDS